MRTHRLHYRCVPSPLDLIKMTVVGHQTESVILSIESRDVAERLYGEVDKAWCVVRVRKDQQKGVVRPMLKLSWIATRFGFDCGGAVVLDYRGDAINAAGW
jgi:hypothetical protein